MALQAPRISALTTINHTAGPKMLVSHTVNQGSARPGSLSAHE